MPCPVARRRRHPGQEFPAAFRPPALASWTILFPPQTISLPHVQPTDPRVGIRVGFPRSACIRPSRGGCRLYPGAAVFTRPTKCPRSPPAASQRPALHPGLDSTHPRLTLTRCHNGSLTFILPAFPLPAPADGSQNASASSLSFTPRCYQQRMSGRGQANRTLTRATSSASPPTSSPTRHLHMRPRVAPL